MSCNALPDRPNFVTGLNAKRYELIRYRKQLNSEMRTVTTDIDHLEAAIRLFGVGDRPFTAAPYVVHHTARKGAVRKFILGKRREPQSRLRLPS